LSPGTVAVCIGQHKIYIYAQLNYPSLSALQIIPLLPSHKISPIKKSAGIKFVCCLGMSFAQLYVFNF